VPGYEQITQRSTDNDESATARTNLHRKQTRSICTQTEETEVWPISPIVHQVSPRNSASVNIPIDNASTSEGLPQNNSDNPVFLPVLSEMEVKSAQRHDPKLTDIFLNIDLFPKYCIRNDILFRQFDNGTIRLVIPQTLVPKILRLFHDTPIMAHRAYAKTYPLIAQKYYWKNMLRDLRNFIKACPICAMHKGQRPHNIAPLEQPPEITAPNQVVSIDCVGKCTPISDGNLYYLSILDEFSKLITLVPLVDLSADSVARALFTKHIAIYGPMKILMHDNASNFLSKVMDSLCKLFGIQRINILPYHAQRNGSNERSHASIAHVISTLMSETGEDWSKWLIYAQISHNFTPHASHGFKPIELHLGYNVDFPFPHIEASAPNPCYVQDPDFPTEIHMRMAHMYRQAQKNIAQARVKAKHQYDRKSKYAIKFFVDQYVYLQNTKNIIGISSKFQKKFYGPFIIRGILNNVSAKLENPHSGKILLAHVNRLKPQYNHQGGYVFAPPRQRPIQQKSKQLDNSYPPSNQTTVRRSLRIKEKDNQCSSNRESLPRIYPQEGYPRITSSPRTHETSTSQFGTHPSDFFHYKRPRPANEKMSTPPQRATVLREPQVSGPTTQLSHPRQEDRTTETNARNSEEHEERISTPHQGEQVPRTTPPPRQSSTTPPAVRVSASSPSTTASNPPQSTPLPSSAQSTSQHRARPANLRQKPPSLHKHLGSFFGFK